MLRHAVDAAKVAAVGDRYAQVRDGALERVDQLRRTRLSAVKLNGRCVVHQHHGLYAYVRSPLRHHIGSLADIGYVVQESLPPMAASLSRLAIKFSYSAGYWRTGGALVGQGDAGCAGAAVIGAGAAAAAGFFVAGFLGAGFLVDRGC